MTEQVRHPGAQARQLLPCRTYPIKHAVQTVEDEHPEQPAGHTKDEPAVDPVEIEADEVEPTQRLLASRE